MARFAKDPILARLPIAAYTCPLRFKVRTQSFSHLHCLTLRPKWHRDRSLATRRCWGRQQRLGSLHVRRYIVDPLSVSLDTLRAGHLLAAATVHFATHRSAKKRSTTIAPNFSFCKALETLLPHANVVCHFLQHTGLHCSRSEWHHDRSLAPTGIAIAHSVWHRDRSLRLGVTVASISLAVFDFRRLHGSNPHDFSSVKLHLGMVEEFLVKQQSEILKHFGRRPSLFGLRRRSKWENDWVRTLKCNGQVYAAIGRRAKIGSFAKRATAN